MGANKPLQIVEGSREAGLKGKKLLGLKHVLEKPQTCKNIHSAIAS